MYQEHDRGFRAILDNAAVFADLLQTFVQEEWTCHIKPEEWERVNTSFVTDTFEKREADIIDKLKRTNRRPQDLYFYCLLEIQPTVDHSMPFRLCSYMTSFWSGLLKTLPDARLTSRGFRLPLIVPITP